MATSDDCASRVAYSSGMSIAEEVLTLERAALDRWGKGDPGGCLELYAPDVTYFDPMVPLRIDGLAAMEAYYAPITGKISIDRFEYLNPEVKCNGDMAILTAIKVIVSSAL